MVDLNVSRETLRKLEMFIALFEKWQSRINLISKKERNELWGRHILDSLQLLKYIPRNAQTLVDLGSGGGFPGAILAIASANIHVTLVDSDERKCIFLQEVMRLTESKATIRNMRIERLSPETWDVVTARACAPLATLCGYAHPIMHCSTQALFLKGKSLAGEVKDAGISWRFSLEIIPSVTDATASVAKIAKLQPISGDARDAYTN